MYVDKPVLRLLSEITIWATYTNVLDFSKAHSISEGDIADGSGSLAKDLKFEY